MLTFLAPKQNESSQAKNFKWIFFKNILLLPISYFELDVMTILCLKRYYCPVWNLPPWDQTCHSNPSKPPPPSRALTCPGRTQTTEKGAGNSPVSQSWWEMKQKRLSSFFQMNFVILTTHLRVVLHFKKLNLLFFENPLSTAGRHWVLNLICRHYNHEGMEGLYVGIKITLK